MDLPLRLRIKTDDFNDGEVDDDDTATHDEIEIDSAYGGSGGQVSTTSVMSMSLLDMDTRTSLKPLTSISEQSMSFSEGRKYQHYRSGRYLLPNDQDEQDREEVKHFMLLRLTDGGHFLSPVAVSRYQDRPAVKIIDLGTGTGTWAIEVADRFPNAQVTGIDLSPIQPAWTPPNVEFFVDDIEDEWITGHDFSLVHARHVLPFLKDPAGLVRRSFDHLLPGGWIESQDIGHLVCCDDDTMPEEYPIAKLFHHITTAWGKLGADLRVGPKLEGMMREAGCVNVQTRRFKIPIGTWMRKPKEKELGVSFRMVIEGVVAALAHPIAADSRWSDGERDVFIRRCHLALRDSSVHAYMFCYFVMGQKPVEGRGEDGR